MLGEVVLLLAGLQVLRLTGAPSQTKVAWIALVVGLHFIAFAVVLKEVSSALPGAVLALLGVAGLALAGTSTHRWVSVVSGVSSGFVLLAGSVSGAGVEIASGKTP